VTKRMVLLVALIWVPFLAIFGFASPAVTDAIGDSYPHMAFHVLAAVLLVSALVLLVRLRRETPDRLPRVLFGILTVTVSVAVIGNLVELVAAVNRFASDGWVSRRTEDLFGPHAGLHTLGANLTIPALMASMVLVLVSTGVTALKRRRNLESVS
jgi:MFS superfamily sulfate permease-like transporter